MTTKTKTLTARKMQNALRAAGHTHAVVEVLKAHTAWGTHTPEKWLLEGSAAACEAGAEMARAAGLRATVQPEFGRSLLFVGEPSYFV